MVPPEKRYIDRIIIKVGLMSSILEIGAIKIIATIVNIPVIKYDKVCVAPTYLVNCPGKSIFALE